MPPKSKLSDNTADLSMNENNLAEQNQSLRSEIDQLKAMIMTMMETKKSEAALENDELPVIPPNKLINVTSLYYGGMDLKGANNSPKNFRNFGMTLPISFEDLSYIVGNHRSHAEQGYFYIQDKQAIRALYLEDHYKNILSADRIKNIILLEDNELKSILETLTNGQKETVEQFVVNGVINNETGYTNRSKVMIIGDYCGKDLWKIAQDRIHELNQ